MIKKIVIIFLALNLFITGCSVKTQDNETAKQIVTDLSEKDYEIRIKEITNKQMDKIIVEDFDHNGRKEAFVLMKNDDDGNASNPSDVG